MEDEQITVTTRDVATFMHNCVAIRSHYMHAKILFESGVDNQKLLQRAAPVFFGDLNSILNRFVILNICVITDPEETLGKKNLTATFLASHAHKLTEDRDVATVAKLSQTMNAFRIKLLPARNKLISHLDRETAHGRTNLGAVSDDEWHEFWLALRDFLQIFHRLYFGPDGLFDLDDIDIISDADSLLNRLRLAEKAF